jgi:U3 small nucleolar RNA-associated protein 4
MSKSQKLVMSAFFNSISLWRLGQAENVDTSSKHPALPEMVQPHQLALELKLKPDCNITSSALSEDANWIAVSDVENVRLFRVHQGVQLYIAYNNESNILTHHYYSLNLVN